jgi:uncharacterized membrane protein YfcA
MFGVGGGFLMTPLLILIGIPPAIAVSTVPTHMAASSFSGTLSYWRKKLVDRTLAVVLLGGSLVGTWVGVWFFSVLRRMGQLDLFISVAYIILLTGVGAMLSVESFRAIIRAWRGTPPVLRRPGTHAWFHGLPLKMRFRESRIYVSSIPVVVIGFSIGFLGAILGVGGGFLLVPSLIYLLRVPTTVSVASSMFITLMTMLLATILQSAQNHTVDAVLGLTLMAGGVMGAQFGSRAGQAIRAEQLRLLLGLLILGVAARVASDLIHTPVELFSVIAREVLK